jgi:mannitol-1-/sugar-/sorbitol-6-phosphatase
MTKSQRPQIRAFLFDLDGTLRDSEVLYVDAVWAALLKRSQPIARDAALELVYGRAWTDIYEEVAGRFPRAYENIEEMGIVVREIFDGLAARRDIRIPGSIQLLKRLAQTYPVAVVSGAPRVDVGQALESMGIASNVRFFLGTEDYSPGKPDPICYLTAAGKLGVLPETCVVFEDSSAGIAAAKRAGMYCVALRREDAPPQDVALADAVLGDLAEFDPESFRR